MSSVGSQRPGGRTARTRVRVHEAALRLLASRGISFGVEELADEAGVHKTTLYRRWSTVADVLGEVAAEVIERDVPVPDTGTLEGDLRAFAEGIAAVIRHPIQGPAMIALFSAPASFVEVNDVIERFWGDRLPALQPVVDRAIGRGEIPAGSDASLLFETLGAPMYHRLFLTRLPIDDDTVDRVVTITLDAARSGRFVRELSTAVGSVG